MPVFVYIKFGHMRVRNIIRTTRVYIHIYYLMCITPFSGGQGRCTIIFGISIVAWRGGCITNVWLLALFGDNQPAPDSNLC